MCAGVLPRDSCGRVGKLTTLIHLGPRLKWVNHYLCSPMGLRGVNRDGFAFWEIYRVQWRVNKCRPDSASSSCTIKQLFVPMRRCLTPGRNCSVSQKTWSPSDLAEAENLLACIRLLGSDCGRDTSCFGQGFHGFPSFLQEYGDIVSHVRREWFLIF